jgi:hypothetical protein
VASRINKYKLGGAAPVLSPRFFRDATVRERNLRQSKYEQRRSGRDRHLLFAVDNKRHRRRTNRRAEVNFKNSVCSVAKPLRVLLYGDRYTVLTRISPNYDLNRYAAWRYCQRDLNIQL